MYYIQITHVFYPHLLMFSPISEGKKRILQNMTRFSFFSKSILLTKQLYYFQKGLFVVLNPLADPYLSPTNEALSRKNGQPVFDFHTSNAIE